MTQAFPTPEKTEKIELFRATDQQESILEHLGRHELLTVNHLVYLLFGTFDNETTLDIAQASVRRTLRILKRKGFVSCNWYRPENFRGKGKYPLAYWLLSDGATWVKDHYPAIDPKSHGAIRSEQNILHDLLRADVRAALYSFAQKVAADIGCRKSNLTHTIKPDDLYEITKSKTIRLFAEVERVKKSYEEMYDKLEPYVRVRGTHEFKQLWGFSYFTVLIPMRDIESMQNLIIHLRGACNCADYRFRKMHKNAPFKLQSQHLWFTTTESIINNTGGKIFFSTADDNPHSLLDLIS